MKRDGLGLEQPCWVKQTFCVKLTYTPWNSTWRRTLFKMFQFCFNLILLCVSLVVKTRATKIIDLLEGQTIPLELANPSICQDLNSWEPNNRAISAKFDAFGLSRNKNVTFLVSVRCHKLFQQGEPTWDLVVGLGTRVQLFANCNTMTFGSYMGGDRMNGLFPFQNGRVYAVTMGLQDMSMTTLVVNDVIITGDGMEHSKQLVEDQGNSDDIILASDEVTSSISSKFYSIQYTPENVPRNCSSIVPRVLIDPAHPRVSQPVSIHVRYYDEGRELKSANTIFRTKIRVAGTSARCDHESSTSCIIKFPLSGVFRLEILFTGQDGTTCSEDHDIIVRKHGDERNIAKDLLFGRIFSHNGLRPLHRHLYRGNLDISQRLGWNDSYYFGNDVESERLFDFRMLEKLKGGWAITRCMDRFLAGTKLPEADRAKGHNKLVLFAPMKYDTSSKVNGLTMSSIRPIEVATMWNESTLYGCTQHGLEELIANTGMFDFINQALIRDSYGSLSLDVNPLVAKGTTLSDDYDNGQSPYRMLSDALSKAAQAYPPDSLWVRVAVSPLPIHRLPDYKVWFQGPKDIFITSSCSVSSHHMLHELGHMFGFRHPQKFRIPQDDNEIISPMHASGRWIKDYVYQDTFNVLGCCSGDFPLAHRILLGWIKPSDLQTFHYKEKNTNHTNIILWPFDLPEISKSKSPLGIAIKSNASHVTICGLRELAHFSIPIRFTKRGIECIQVVVDDQSWNPRGPIDFSLLKASEHRESTLLSQGMSWFEEGSKSLLVFKGNVDCPGSSHEHERISGYIGMNDDYPFKEAYKVSSYSTEYSCASVTVIPQAEAPTVPVLLDITLLEGSHGTLECTWNSSDIRMAGITVQTIHSIETLQSQISPDATRPILPPISMKINEQMDLLPVLITGVTYDGQSFAKNISQLNRTYIQISTWYSNNYNSAIRHVQQLPLELPQQTLTINSHGCGSCPSLPYYFTAAGWLMYYYILFLI